MSGPENETQSSRGRHQRLQARQRKKRRRAPLEREALDDMPVALLADEAEAVCIGEWAARSGEVATVVARLAKRAKRRVA